jgi:hypothetical protein
VLVSLVTVTLKLLESNVWVLGHSTNTYSAITGAYFEKSEVASTLAMRRY